MSAHIWHHLLTHDVITACETVVEHSWEVDSLLEEYGAEARLHLAEALSRAAAQHNLVLPPTDGALAFRLRFAKHPITTRVGGTIMRTADGRLGYNIGDGRTVESSGRSLTIITKPDTARYVTGYRLTSVTYT